MLSKYKPVRKEQVRISESGLRKCLVESNQELRRRQWQPTPVLLPGKSHGRRSLVGCSPWGQEESDTTEQIHFHALEKEMATHSSVLAWRIPGTVEPWWAAICGVAQSQTQLKQLSSSSSNQELKGEREMIGTEVIRNGVWRNGIKQAWNVGQLRDEPGKYPFHSKYSGMYLLFCFAGKLRPVQFSSVTQSCPTVCDPVNRSTPGLPVRHQLPESTQTHVPWVSDAIQPSHPLSSPNPSALNLSQHQGLFKWVSSLH